MKITKSTKLGAVLALGAAIATSLLAITPASAETVARANFVETHRGPVEMVRYSHRSERSYRDMRWREMRFHHHVRAWFWRHHEHRDFDR